MEYIFIFTTIFLIVGFVAYGSVALYFALHTPKEDIDKIKNPAVVLFYWTGVIFGALYGALTTAAMIWGAFNGIF
jgi:hypothetical protein